MGDHGTFDTIKMLGNNGHLLITVTPAQATVDYISSSSTAGTVNYSYTILPHATRAQPTPSPTMPAHNGSISGDEPTDGA